MILPVNPMLVLTCVRASSYVSFTRRTYFSGTTCSLKHLQTSCRGTLSYAFSRSINTRCSAFCISRCFSITCLAANMASVVPLPGITMLHHVLQRLERKNTYARILLIDFSKAFDHIDHNILLDKLKTNGVPQICVDWKKAFLTRRTQRVKLADTTSDWTEMAGGVPQGTLSGPENFLNMIDDLHTDVDDVKFVDDVTLYEVCNTHSQNKLQNAVNDIQMWATANNMSLNASKTKELLVYYGREELDIPRITINGDVIERVSCAKLLGCHIMSNLSWEDHIANLVSKASRRLHLLRELKRAGLSTKDLLTCYFSIVRSTTEYACQVWSTSLTNEQRHAVETIQRRAMQIISPTRLTRRPYTNTG